MKNLIMIAAFIMGTSVQADFIKRSIYTGKCQLGVPLSTYSVCNEDYGVGLEVAECALDEAHDKCKGDKNFDCVDVSVKVTEQASVEFPGYKVCKASARVHGYGF